MDGIKTDLRLLADHGHRIMAAIVLVLTFLIYNVTKAPTLSFWDCGEFISCAYILGIPHPPGNPLYVMIGRLFSIVPFHDDISARVNMLSAISGALAAMMAFLIAYRMIRWWWAGDEMNGWKKIATYGGAFVGAMMFAFGRTQWSNSVEAEVYTPAMLLMTLIIWLTLQWIEKRRQSGSSRYLYLITYLAFLSIGIHLTTFLIMPAIFLAVILFSPRLRRDVRFYLTGLALILIGHDFEIFIWVFGSWLVIVAVAAVLTRQRSWVFCLLLLLSAAAGFSCQLFTPIRSAQRPAINMNDPSSSYSAFKDFLERRQYGNESMIKRAFQRRGEWANQFGTYERVGFWGFFSNQYGLNGRAFAFLFVLGLLGLYEIIRRQPRWGWPFLLMVLLGTVFLVWYMNFADGTRLEQLTGEGHIEVRDRDYFFTPGFVLFGLAIGLGVAGFMEMGREAFARHSRPLKKAVMVMMTFLLVLAVVPVKANYHVSDRSGNYIPYDIAYNYLTSCDPEAILLIGGDNDTYPIWCLQNVYGYRTDVTVVNLSLANLDWYIRQIRDEMGIPIRLNDAQIENLRSEMLPGGRLYRPQDRVSDEILNVNRWKRPIHFAITIGEEMRQYSGRGIEQNLVMQGLVYRLVPGTAPGKIDLEKGRDLFLNKFRYRSIADSGVYQDSRTSLLSGNYTTGLVLMADSLRKAGQYDEAIFLTRKAIEIVPSEYSTFNYLADLYAQSGQDSQLVELMRQVPASKVHEMYLLWAQAKAKQGQRETAKDLLRQALKLNPSYKAAFRQLTWLLFDERSMKELQAEIENWLRLNPEDPEAKQQLDGIKQMGSPADRKDSIK